MERIFAFKYSIFHPKTIYFFTTATHEIQGEKLDEGNERKTENNYTSRTLIKYRT